MERKAPMAIFFAGVMYSDDRVYEKARAVLERELGEFRRESPEFLFDFTDYYGPEMGAGLVKRFLSFAEPLERDTLARLKVLTNGIEKDLSVEGRRTVNIDPGYATPHNVVLATTKEFPHRIYLGEGIFAEVTMTFRRSGPEYFPWTYEDYRTPLARDFFIALRHEALELPEP